MEDRSSMGLNDDGRTNDSGITGGPSGPDTGLPTPGDQPGPVTGPSGGTDGLGGGEPGLTRDPMPAGLADGAYVAKFVIAVDGPAGSGK